MKNKLWLRVLVTAVLAATCVFSNVTVAATATNAGYVQVNLVSDATNAAHVDARLLNAWGIAVVGGTVWVNANHSGLTIAYSLDGRKLPGTIHIPAPAGGPGAPSCLAFNTTGQFVVTNGSRHGAATFLIATEEGTITS